MWVDFPYPALVNVSLSPDDIITSYSLLVPLRHSLTLSIWTTVYTYLHRGDRVSSVLIYSVSFYLSRKEKRF